MTLAIKFYYSIALRGTLRHIIYEHFVQSIIFDWRLRFLSTMAINLASHTGKTYDKNHQHHKKYLLTYSSFHLCCFQIVLAERSNREQGNLLDFYPVLRLTTNTVSNQLKLRLATLCFTS